jgi:co-chaperonin GroES (HSP10)
LTNSLLSNLKGYMDNYSGVTPVGHRVVVLPEETDTTTASGIVLATASQAEREQMAQVEGVLIAVGSTAWADQPEPWAAVGDRVMFGKYTGIVRKGSDGKSYRIINDLDVVAKLDKEVAV